MRIKRHLRCQALALAFLVMLAVSFSSARPAYSETGTGEPTITLIAAQHSIDIPSSNGFVIMDPGISVASLGSTLEFQVARASYTQPLTITQLVHNSFGQVRRRPLPTSVLESVPLGLLDFLNLTVRNSTGETVASSRVLFCPNSMQPKQVVPTAPPSSPYPLECISDPFPMGMTWGIQKDWEVDPLTTYGPPVFQLSPGSYEVTESITPTYRQMFGISATDASATVQVRVVAAKSGSSRSAPLASAGSAHPPSLGLAAASSVPDLNNPPPGALPDLVAMPSWGISTSHAKSGADLLDFGATVWVGGNAPLDIVGFRPAGSSTMQAYQYFWDNDHVIGRTRVGTMVFDKQEDHDHWHFENFAAYRLLDSAKNVVVLSDKVGFCITPTDAVDLVLPHSVWKPDLVGFAAACGMHDPSLQSVQEMLPLGWGDTYVQTLDGQSFNITNVPNGTYYIEITANPLTAMHELTSRNDVSQREVILGGTPGHRTVTVPAWNGIDPEG